MDKFEEYLNKKENKKIKLALTDTTAVTLKKVELIKRIKNLKL